MTHYSNDEILFFTLADMRGIDTDNDYTEHQIYINSPGEHTSIDMLEEINQVMPPKMIDL